MADRFVSPVTLTSHAKASLAAYGMATTGHMGVLDLSAAFIAVGREANRRTAKQLIALGAAFERGIVNGSKVQELNDRILRQAQQSTVASYTAQRGGPSGYRSKERFSGGKLRRALNSREFFTATSTTMHFANVTNLNTEAVQWGRLNFGAGAAGRSSPRSRMFPLRISNMVIDVLGLEGEPGDPFTIPVGFFNGRGEFHTGFPSSSERSGEGRSNFRVIREKKVTAGIRAEHFLDAGLARIVTELWPSYQRHIATLVEDGEITNLRPSTNVTSNKPTPRPRSR